MNLLETIDQCNDDEPLGEKQIDFVMCNPPFFANEKELAGNSSSIRRPEKRSKPKSANTAQMHEAVYEDGGEVGFLKKVIEESFKIGKRVKCENEIFSFFFLH